MHPRQKALLARILEVVGFFGAIYSFQRVYASGLAGDGALLSLVMLLAFALVAAAGAILARFYAVRAEDETRSDRVAVETLARLGREQAKAAGKQNAGKKDKHQD